MEWGEGPSLVAALSFQRLLRADITEIVVGKLGNECWAKGALRSNGQARFRKNLTR